MSDQPVLVTERLVLRPFRLDDAVRVRELANTREIADMTLNIPYPYPEGGAEKWIGSHPTSWSAGTGAVWAMTLPTDDQLVGAIGLRIEPEHRRAELGYWIGVPFWGRGYATEASRVVVAWGFDAADLHRISAHYLPGNTASRRVMEKIGMQEEGLLRALVWKDDRPLDLVARAILRTDPRL